MLGERFERALVFAARRHADQVRKGTDIPYVSHLLSVCALVIEGGGGEDEAIAALLHDAVEDQKATLEEIGAEFGDAVAHIVDQCSDTDEEPKPPWLERKRQFVARVPQLTEASRLVARADKLHNVRSILVDYRECGEQAWDKFKGGRDGTLWYYRAVADALGEGPLQDQLQDAVAALESAADRATI
jgi:(p)ppGpp synthase/HD superfamily hydrolase